MVTSKLTDFSSLDYGGKGKRGRKGGIGRGGREEEGGREGGEGREGITHMYPTP